MVRTLQARIDDMLDAIAGIEGITGSLTFEQFSENWQAQRAVERGLEIISEASRGLSPELKAESSAIPWVEIAGIGNILRHEYQRVDASIVWNTARNYLTDLKTALLQLQTKLD